MSCGTLLPPSLWQVREKTQLLPCCKRKENQKAHAVKSSFRVKNKGREDRHLARALKMRTSSLRALAFDAFGCILVDPFKGGLGPCARSPYLLILGNLGSIMGKTRYLIP